MPSQRGACSLRFNLLIHPTRLVVPLLAASRVFLCWRKFACGFDRRREQNSPAKAPIQKACRRDAKSDLPVFRRKEPGEKKYSRTLRYRGRVTTVPRRSIRIGQYWAAAGEHSAGGPVACREKRLAARWEPNAFAGRQNLPIAVTSGGVNRPIERGCAAIGIKSGSHCGKTADKPEVGALASGSKACCNGPALNFS